MHLFRPFSNPLRAEIERPRFVYDDGNLTVGKYLDRFLEDVQRGYVRESTYSRNKYLVASHAKPALGVARQGPWTTGMKMVKIVAWCPPW